MNYVKIFVSGGEKKRLIYFPQKDATIRVADNVCVYTTQKRFQLKTNTF